VVALGLTVDAYGHVTSYNPSVSGDGMTLISGVPGQIIATLNNMPGGAPGPISYTLGLPTQDLLGPIPPTINVDEYSIKTDLQGRITQVIRDPNWTPPGNQVQMASKLFTSANRVAMQLSIVTTIDSVNLRVSYKGRLGANTTKGYALSPLGYSLVVDGVNYDFVVYSDATNYINLEGISGSLAPGEHTVTVSVPSAISDAGVLDVTVCRQ
jgi:hypothetical protein